MTADRGDIVRGAGWEYVFVAIDDYSRIAFSQILPDERRESAVAFLQAALTYYRSLGVLVQRVMTDPGSCFRSRLFAQALRALGTGHVRTRPDTPRTNGKAERFLQTLQREWAYARTYTRSRHQTRDLPGFLHDYNWQHQHGGIGYQALITRLPPAKHYLLAMRI